MALVSTEYPPLRTSGAVQMRDLAHEFIKQGHEPVVMIPTYGLSKPWVVEEVEGVTVFRVKVGKFREINYLRRTLAEFMMPFTMIRSLKRSVYADVKWDLVAWYSPTIFFAPLIKHLKTKTNCYAYLILRDIFPEWAVDLGIMKKRLAYGLLKMVAHSQYDVADTIGVQTESNISYLAPWVEKPNTKVEVLNNWQCPHPDTGTSIDFEKLLLTDRKILVYTGNMGVAQGMDIWLDLAHTLSDNEKVIFLFVGRGSEVLRLKNLTQQRQLNNIVFVDEVPSEEMAGLLKQCTLGLLSLDPRHKSHNIPGKFLTYLFASLPVLAYVNLGTDLEKLIKEEAVGGAFNEQSELSEIRKYIELLIKQDQHYDELSKNCQNLAKKLFSPETTVNQIVDAVKSRANTDGNCVD